MGTQLYVLFLKLITDDILLFKVILIIHSVHAGMEIYSTTLWHLQKEVALSALAQELTDVDRSSPQVSLLLITLYLD